MAQLYAGTSGFAYDAWKPAFYPEELKAKQFLSYYATRLNAVEINYTFRRLPTATTLENWVQTTPEGFTFIIKAHQRLTHIQRLKPISSLISQELGNLAGPRLRTVTLSSSCS